jgi:hypothetical protein
MRTAPILRALVLVLCGAATAAAQQTPSAQRPAGRGAAPSLSPVKPAELANALDRYALAQARRSLQLTDVEYQQLMPRLRHLQQTRRRNMVARNRLIQDLRRLAGPRAAGEPADDAVLDALRALREHDERSLRDLQAAYESVDQVLTPRQRARFRLFEDNIEARKLDLLLRSRARPPAGG